MSALLMLQKLAYWVMIGWGTSSAFALLAHSFGVREGRLYLALVRMHRELWLFAPPGLLMNVYGDWAGRDWVGMFFALCSWVSWWILRNWPDDNIWKRRGKRALGRVRAVAGRLVVSPA
jgi:hypothetical protein